jgi:CHRD domain/PEP-CTERM motif
MNLKTVSALAAVSAAFTFAAPAHAITYVFSANLTGAAESPPVSTGAFGAAVVTFDDVALTVAVQEIFSSLTTPASASHIHCCTAVAGVGTVGVSLGFTSFPAVQTGFYSNTFTLSAASFATLLTGTQAGKAYVNVHNATYPGGEIRGWLAAAPVPEPGSYGLMLGGLAAVGLLARRRPRA